MEDICISIIAKIAENLVHPILRRASYLFCFNKFAGNLRNEKKDLELRLESVRERARRAINRTEKIEPSVENWLKDVENVLEEVQKLEGKIEAAGKCYNNCFSLLDQEEAWTLFKLFAGINDHEFPSDMKDVGRKIADECKGLPIAIVTVGSSLRGRSFEEWELALSRLEDSEPMDIPKGLRSPYACLKLSYDNLTNEIAKTLFLLCSIFPEDYEIKVEDLVRFGKGLGPVGTRGITDKARKEMHAAVNILVDSCLLLHLDNRRGCVKMHDMVRDVALWIASQKGQSILVEMGMNPRILVENETVRDKTAISLWDLKNGQLPVDQLNFPMLEILLLHSKSDSGFEIPDTYFEGMKMLKTLAFIRFTYEWELYISRLTNTSVFTLSLPQSVKSLTNLQTLCLRGYKLGNISVLESLKGLEILDLRGSSFDELPNSIATLKKLKVLDLYSCWIEKNNPYEVIGRCSQLEDLYVFLWKMEDFSLENVSLPRLRRYSIIHSKSTNIDYHKYSSQIEILSKHGPSRALCIEDFNAYVQSFASLPIKDLFVRSESLYLKQLQGGYKNIIPSMDLHSMNHLSYLVLEHCSEIARLVDTTLINAGVRSQSQTEAVFSKLVILRLHHMYGLEQVFHDPSSSCFSLNKLEEIRIENCTTLYSISFPRNSNLSGLKILKIEKCQMLTTSLFTTPIAQTLESLEELRISKCSKLKHIIEEDYEEEEEEEGNVQRLSSSMMLQNLRILEVEGCERLESILPITFSQGLVRLEEMRIRNNGGLKYVFGTQKEHHHLQSYQNFNSKETNIKINLNALRSLRLSSLPNLIDIWPESCHPNSPNLRGLECSKCPKLSASSVRKVVINSYMQQDSTSMEKDTLWVVDTNLNQLCSQTVPVALQSVLNFSVLILTHLRVGGILELQFKGQHNNKSKPEQALNLALNGFRLIDLPDLSFIWRGPRKFLSLEKLRMVYVEKCPKLKAIFSSTIVKSLPMLTQIRVLNCEELEQIFVSDDGDDGDDDDEQVVLCFPKLWYIEVAKCNNLRWLFFNFMACHFPSLDTLEIKDCNKLEKVFGFENEADIDDKDVEKVMLQNLRFLMFRNLPNLTQVQKRFKMRLVRTDIVNCPKY
ncbi:putative disease resistance protein [Senna tora]|uniref:Putative disease resistance protein n=1 Tax=Senna tora TaxID=362788 RepID=A0A834T6W3_9FABA|nr:putative disease resistance protein [Senna tora]